MCERKHMQLETKFLRLPEPAAVGDHLDGWRVCWLGGWDRSQLFYWVMVVRIKPAAGPPAVCGRLFFDRVWQIGMIGTPRVAQFGSVKGVGCPLRQDLTGART